MKTFLCSPLVLVIFGTLAFRGGVYADHDKSCKNVHGKITVVTESGISVGDKLYRVGDTTRIIKGDKKVKLSELSAGDVVCVDVRGKNEIGGGEVAAVTVLSPSDPLPATEKQYVREKETVRRVGHDKNCSHVHGKVTRVEDSTLIVNGQSYECRATTRILKNDRALKIESIKAGDYVCIDADEAGVDHKVTTVVVLDPSDSAPFESREIIREREKIRETK